MQRALASLGTCSSNTQKPAGRLAQAAEGGSVATETHVLPWTTTNPATAATESGITLVGWAIQQISPPAFAPPRSRLFGKVRGLEDSTTFPIKAGTQFWN